MTKKGKWPLTNGVVCPYGESQLDLSGRLVDVEDGDVDGHQLLLWDGQGDAEEGVEGVGLLLAGGAGQGAPELGLEDVHHEAVVGPHVSGQGVRRQNLVTPGAARFTAGSIGSLKSTVGKLWSCDNC